MKIHRLEDFKRGWVIGDFVPSILRTKDFEIGILSHKAGEKWPKHYHKEAVEYNILISGEMIVNDQWITSGDVFIFEKGEIAAPQFITDCQVVVIKVPSIPGDKYEV